MAIFYRRPPSICLLLYDLPAALAWSSMPSPRKFKPPRSVNHTPAKRRRIFILCAGVLFGVVIGAIIGAVVYFTHRTPIDLGTFYPATIPARVGDKELFATYAGSSTCRECHAKEYDLWSKSHHGLAERDPDLSLDKAAFEPPRSFDHGSQKTQVRIRDDKYEIVTLGYGPAPAPYIVQRVIGIDPLRQFLVATTGGRLQTLEAAYDPRRDQWFNVYGNEDRKPGEWGHWTGRGMNWNSQCASCHNTRVRKNYDEKTDAYQTAMAQMTVSCESCHGPMKQHVASQKSYPAAPHHPTSPSPHPRFSKDQVLDTCASCHARRAELTDDFAPGDSFHDHYSLSIPDLSDLFYPDGQVKEEDYEFTAFLGSKMHAAGVRCGDCHEPHSSKPLFAGNALCMRCHNGSFQGSPIIVPEQHSFHKSDSLGNQCVNCHMPQTTYMQRHGRHDHGFAIPDPLLTQEHKIPNACNRCHADKKTDWSLATVEKWYGAKMQRPTRERARWIAKARTGDDAARAAMLHLLKEEKQPFWQAVAAAVLSQWAAAPDVLPALTAALDHPNALVRENAARSLMPIAQQNQAATRQALEKRLTDPIRAVRVRAAWALRDAINPDSAPGRDLLAYLRQNADQPGGAAEQGAYHAARNDLGAAAASFGKAVTWDPNSAPLRDSLANVLILQGQTAAAAEQLQWAAKLAPHEYMYPYKLGLAYDRLGQSDKAIAALRQAEALNPRDPQVPYARATIHAKAGQKQDAREAAEQALRIDPSYKQAAQLLRELAR
jgi:Flp pilus assembly protein TadD